MENKAYKVGDKVWVWTFRGGDSKVFEPRRISIETITADGKIILRGHGNFSFFDTRADAIRDHIQAHREEIEAYRGKIVVEEGKIVELEAMLAEEES